MLIETDLPVKIEHLRCKFLSLQHLYDSHSIFNYINMPMTHLIDLRLSNDSKLLDFKRQWLELQHKKIGINLPYYESASTDFKVLKQCTEHEEVDWLISVFNHLFHKKNVALVRGGIEPEYFPAQDDQPARIEFAHGFFSSALHEISHWSIAGTKRRQQLDFGYWYIADGRNLQQQQSFEQLEVKPQAIECLLTLMCKKTFNASKDNLNTIHSNNTNAFENNVLILAQNFISTPHLLPQDARTLLKALAYLCHD